MTRRSLCAEALRSKSSNSASTLRYLTHCCAALSRTPVRGAGLTLRSSVDSAVTCRAQIATCTQSYCSCSVLLRLLAQQGRFPGYALDLGRMQLCAQSRRSARSACSRALVLACAGRVTTLWRSWTRFDGTSNAVELVCLHRPSMRSALIRSSASDIVERVSNSKPPHSEQARSICWSRPTAAPEVLPILLRAREAAAVPGAGRASRRRRPSRRCRTVRSPSTIDSVLLLSRRERDVFELLVNGLTNREIGKASVHRRVDREGARAPHLRQARRSLPECLDGPGRRSSGRVRRLRRRIDVVRRRLSRDSGRTREVGTLREPVVLLCTGENRLERRDRCRVELTIDRLGEPQARHPARHRIAVRAVRRHRVVCIRDRDDP